METYQVQKEQLWCLTSGDFTVLGEILGEAFGDFDVEDFASFGFEVCGGVPGSDADFSVSFFNTAKQEGHY